MIRNLLTTARNRLDFPLRVLSIGLLVLGIFRIETASASLLNGLCLSLTGSLLLLAIPISKPDIEAKASWFSILAMFGVGAWLLQGSIDIFESPSVKPPNYEQALAFWGGALACFVGSAALWDTRRSIRRLPLVSTDRLLMLFFFVVSFALRAWQVVHRSPVDLPDEQTIFGETVRLAAGFRPHPLDTTPLAFPWVYHWIVFILRPLLQPVADALVVSKLGAAAAASLSVAVWFAVALLYSSRAVAVCAATLLAFSSWHWINSRFLYMYPFDLGLIALSVYFLCSAIKTGSLMRGALAGVVVALSLVSQKIAMMTLPFSAFVFAEAWLFGAKERRRELYLLGAVWTAGLACAFLPFAIHYLTADWMPRQSQILQDKEIALAGYGATKFGVFAHLLGDIFYQLQVAAFDQSRHMIREGKGLLDPVQSGLFILGGLAAIFTIWKSTAARLCVAGMFIFAMPMVLSFPVDSRGDHGLPRRMLGSVFFICWLSAQGAEILCQRLLPATKVGVGMFMLAVTSAIFNVWYVFAYYVPYSAGFPFTELRDIGIQKASMLHSIRGLARNGIPVLVLGDSPDLAFTYALRDLPNVKVFQTVDEIRGSILEHRGKNVYVVIPGNDMAITARYQGVPAALADIVPTYLWLADGMNIHHNPTVRYAFVRVPQ